MSLKTVEVKLKPGDCPGCSFRSEAVCHLNCVELAYLTSLCTVRSFREGDAVFREGDSAGSVFYVREGYIKLKKGYPGGRDHILYLVNDGSYIGLHNLLPEMAGNFITAVALTNAEICEIEKQGFAMLMNSNGAFASQVLSSVCRNEIFFINRLMNNLDHSVNGRLAGLLLYLFEQVYKGNPFDPHLTHHEMASFCGASRESITRAINRFEKDGLIVIRQKKITVLNLTMLKKLSISG